jgi:thymidylate synthase ThyX
MKVSYVRLTGPEWMTGAMRTTTGKDMFAIKKPSLEVWKKMIASTGGVGHSPLRAVSYRIYVEDVPSWVTVHYVRHHVGVQFYVKSQRHLGREEEPQGTLINMMFDINAQSLLSMAKARTCCKAAPQTREVMNLLRREMLQADDYDCMMAQAMIPSCEWYGSCFELDPCGKAK